MNVPLILFIGDVVLSITALGAAHLARLASMEGLIGIPDMTPLVLFTSVSVFSSYLLELYQDEKRRKKREVFLRVLFSLAVSFFGITSLGYLLDIHLFGRGILLLSLLFFGLYQFIWHSGLTALMNSTGLARRVLVLGTGPLAKKIGDLITSTNHHHILKGYVNMTGESMQVPSESVVQNGGGLRETVMENHAQKLVISVSERRGVFPIQEVLDCKFCGIEVIDAPAFYEELSGKLLLENILPSWFIYSTGFKMSSSKKLFKRIFDICGAMAGLTLALPLLPVIAALIKLESRGPVYLRQTRIGELEKTFMLYKFRTMRVDAENGSGAVWAQKDDPRVTRIGRLLRKARIDELPQLFNVLKGDMSLIGPRPERPEFVRELNKIIPYYSERHFVKPGVTGWAQVRYPYGASVEDALEKLRYDLYYIKNISIFLDLLIVLETIKVILFGKGAR